MLLFTSIGKKTRGQSHVRPFTSIRWFCWDVVIFAGFSCRCPSPCGPPHASRCFIPQTIACDLGVWGFKGVFVVFAVACFACRVYTFRGFVYIEKFRCMSGWGVVPSLTGVHGCARSGVATIATMNAGRFRSTTTDWTRLYHVFENSFAQSLAYLGNGFCHHDDFRWLVMKNC